MQSFRARAVAATELLDLNTFAIVLAENLDGSGLRLELQRALSFDRQDRTLGQDTYCIATQDGATYYGGVECWTLNPSSLVLRLSQPAQEVLGVEDGFLVEIPKTYVASLQSALERVFAGET